jgi:hypothetical protein
MQRTPFSPDRRARDRHALGRRERAGRDPGWKRHTARWPRRRPGRSRLHARSGRRLRRAHHAGQLSALRGKVVVVAFYPKDRTSGCTAELTKFRDENAKLFGEDVVVLPVSADSIRATSRGRRR